MFREPELIVLLGEMLKGNALQSWAEPNLECWKHLIEITDWQCHQVQASFQSVALEEDGNVHGLHPRPSEHSESMLRCY